MFKYAEKTVELKYETGYHFRIKYLGEDKLRWTSLVNRVDGAPMSSEETFYLHQQAPEIFTLSWIEQTGFSVTQNLDFEKMEVYAFMSWPDPKERGQRGVLAHRGTIKFVD